MIKITKTQFVPENNSDTVISGITVKIAPKMSKFYTLKIENKKTGDVNTDNLEILKTQSKALASWFESSELGSIYEFDVEME